ncbi:class I SAM-dependent methyltransferase [Immundisolibacter sp.]
MPNAAVPPELLTRLDDTPDAAFYTLPRLVTHLDTSSLAALTTFYAEQLPAGADVLDLISSWVSHLPAGLRLGHVAGLGMNATELAANPRLAEPVVQDLNADPRLPWPDGRFDAALNALSVQYLTRPQEVYDEVARVLRPGGIAIIAHSHRCFPTKAVRAFRDYAPADRLRLCRQYLNQTGAFDSAQLVDRSPPDADPLWIVFARRRAWCPTRAPNHRLPEANQGI